jgi:hypothetical protein
MLAAKITPAEVMTEPVLATVIGIGAQPFHQLVVVLPRRRGQSRGVFHCDVQHREAGHRRQPSAVLGGLASAHALSPDPRHGFWRRRPVDIDSSHQSP